MAGNIEAVHGVEIVSTFLNTLAITEDAPAGHDRWTEPADVDRWWREQGGDGSRPSSSADLDLARDLRAGLRAELAAHNDAAVPGDDRARERLEQATARLPLRVTTGDDVLAAADEEASAPLVAVLAATVRARMDGTWPRLKVCRDPLCREAYLDTSRNRSRTWCSMEVCGARAKQRAFVERRRSRTG